MKITGLMLFTIMCVAEISYAGLTDIIQPLRISTDRQDTVLVSDLFYAKTYNLKIVPNDNVSASFDRKTGNLVLRAIRNDVGAALLEFVQHGVKSCIPLIINSGTKAQQLHRFSFTPEKKVTTVAVSGSFNSWNKDRDQLKDHNGNGVFILDIPLDPGSYIYKFVVDGKEILDPLNSEKTPTGFDDFNSVLRIADTDSSRNFLHIGRLTETQMELALSFMYDNILQTAPLTKGNVIALLDNAKIKEDQIEIKGNTITFRFKRVELKGKKTLRVMVTQAARNTNLQQVQLVDGLPAGAHIAAASWDDGVIYSIMVDRFMDGDHSNDKPIVHDSIFVQANYQGGDFRGVIEKIDEGYFDSLGINILWISPVNDNPDVAFREYPPPHRWYSGYHGYWPISATNVEEKFGTMAELKELIAKAHIHKIKVLLDFVAHHVHIDHPFFKEHPEWFGTLNLPDGRKNLRLWDEFRLSTWFEPYMPSFDYSKSKQALKVVSENAVWWLRETGADGFRHDAVKHVPNEFWRTLTRRIREEI
ncbi:MAG: alpha-amylase family glycosyl hydrolase, partial [Ignavibacteriales bacterium]|nr:alpha-amylase family glycosyl hydrolase [Ignavibacteriales bacterium]